MSVLDFLKENDDEYMTGYYYEKAPKPGQMQAPPQKFHYAKATARQRIFGTVMTNLRLDTERYTVRTCDDCGFKIGGYVSTQSGLFWLIEEVTHDEQTDGNEEALLMWKEAVKTEFVLRMRRVDNPWGIGA